MNRVELLLILLLMLPFSFLQFSSPHLFVTHDGEYHIERIFNYTNAWRDGNWLPSWAQYYNNGFGSPIFVFLFPVVYWLGSLIYWLGLPLVPTLKLLFLIFQLIAAMSAYLWLRRGIGFSGLSAYVGAMAFVYAPYNLAQVFARGSLREFAGTALVPLILLLLIKLEQNFSLRRARLLGLVGGLFLLTDGITAIIFSFFVLAYLVYLVSTSHNRLEFFLHAALSGLVAIMISAFIYLPFAVESSNLREATAGLYKSHFVYLHQFFDPHWGFGFSMEGPNDSLSFQVGIILCISVIALFFLSLRRKIILDAHSKMLLGLLGLFVLLMWHNPITLKIWELLPFLQAVQLPWRFLAPVTLIGAFFAAKAVEEMRLRGKRWFVVFYLLIILISIKYLRTNQVMVFDESKLYYNTDDSTAFHEFIPRWRVTTSQFSGFEPVESVIRNAYINDIQWKSHRVSFRVSAKDASIIRVSRLYFPGWRAVVDGEIVPMEITSQIKNEPRDVTGLISVTVPQGVHRVDLVFTDTTPRKIGKIVSVLGLVFSLLLVFLCKQKRLYLRQ